MKKSIKFFVSILLLITLLFSNLTVFAANYEPEDYTIDAQIAFMINLDTAKKDVVYSKNSKKKAAPASLTKIATAAAAFANGVNLDDTTIVTSKAIHALDGTGAAMAGLKVGEEVTIRQVMYLILLHSGGDACNVLAEYMAGDIDKYMDMVNDWIKSIGCKDTHFVNPVGLDDKNHYTTAEDLAKITVAALEYSEFDTISSTVNYTMAPTNMSGERHFSHRNTMLKKGTGYYYEYASGIKTGTTSGAGRCVITKASKDGYNYLVVIMNAPLKDYTADGLDDNGAFFNATYLFKWAFSTFRFKNVVEDTTVACDIAVKNAKDIDTLQLVPEKTISALVPVGLDSSAVIIQSRENSAKEVKAPVQKGDVLGSANIIYGDEIIATVNLVASKDVELSVPMLVYNSIKDVLSSIWAKILIVILVVLLMVYVLITIIYNNKRKKKRMHEVTDKRKI